MYRVSRTTANKEESHGQDRCHGVHLARRRRRGAGRKREFQARRLELRVSRGEEGDKFKLDETMSSDALLLGRVTYEGFADAWPSREGEFADKFNNMPKYVVSSTLENPEWNNTTVLEGDMAEAGSSRSRGRHRRPRQPPARADADRARPGRRAPADGVPGHAGKRQAPLRRHERHEGCGSSTRRPSATASRSSIYAPAGEAA